MASASGKRKRRDKEDAADWLGDPKKVDINTIIPTEESKKCKNRPLYRRGKKETSVRVYTVNDESRHVLIYNVPAIGVLSELRTLLNRYAPVEEFQVLDSQETEQFTEVVRVQFGTVQIAKDVRRRLGADAPFYGQILRVQYAPEYESVQDTKKKLQGRKEYVFKTLNA